MPLPLAVPSPAFSYVPLRNFDDLTPRPPTPPRDSKASDARAVLLRDSKPQSNSPSSAGSAHLQTGGKARKRVGFSPLRTSYHRLPTFSGDSTYGAPLKPLPPSRELKSSKSILKPFEQPIPLQPTDFSGLPGQGISAHSYANFANMLQSVLQQLAGTVRSNRLDAYFAISGTLRAYQDETPDLEAMTKQMGLFMQFIQRDMCATLESGSLDTALITKALKLLTIFFCSPQLSGALTDEFCSFVMDHAIATVEDAQIPKVLTTHYVHLLMHQKFSHKVMTASRANRLVTALHQEHIKGTGLTADRLVVYQKLLSQARPVMISRAAEWMEHLLSSMLSPIKEIQCRAVEFGMEAGISLGAVKDVSRVISNLSNRETEGTIFVDYLGKRLSKMVADKEDGAHAARVWSVVVMFFRSRPHQLEHWEHIQLWLRVVQECFNSSDMATRNQASIAWNKLVYSISPDAETSEKTIKMLRIPISGPLDKKGNDKSSVNARQMALATLCNLLYYSLSPRAPSKQLDLCWNEHVEEVLVKVFLSGVSESDQACRILAALFDGRQPKPWAIDRATQSNAITPEELPRLDSKWVRSRTGKILNLIEVALSRVSWSDDLNDKAPIQRLWLNFTKTISDAGSLEVKISNELMESMAHMFNMFQRIWKLGPRALGVGANQPRDAFLKRFGFLIRAAMSHIGTICFTEKVLSLDSQQQFEAVSTPSHRSSSSSHGPKLSVSPVLHLFQLCLQLPAGVMITPLYYDMVREMLEACCNSRGSRRTRLELLKQCIQTLQTPTSAYAEPTHITAVWQVIAGLAENAMLMAAQEKALNSPQPVGHEYRDMRFVLEWGAKNHQTYHFQTWKNLLVKFVDSVKQETGDGGVALAIVEPLAGVLKLEEANNNDGIILAYGSLTLEAAVYPRNRQALDAAQKALWGLGIGVRRTPPFDPFDHLYQMINHLLIASYGSLLSINHDNVRAFLIQVSALIDRCPLSLLSNLLKRIQEGIGVWVEDLGHRLGEKDSGLLETVLELWSGVGLAIPRLPRKDSFMLRNLSTLISCGLGSRRKTIANATADLWNSTFGQQNALDYPQKVKNALLRLRPIVDLQLPTFPESVEDEIAPTPPEFSESQEDDITREHIHFSSPTPGPSVYTPSSKERLHLPARDASKSPLRTYTVVHTPEKPSGARSTNLTPKLRLRHDDSQIQFTRIESSPISDTGIDSQLLTAHQKDVRERQHVDAAAMFPDIRSSPKTITPKGRDLFQQNATSSDLLSFGRVAAGDSNTPTLPPPPRGKDDLIESPPTREGNYSPPSPPPMPTEGHTRGREASSLSPPLEAHEQAEVEGTDALDIFRTSAREYFDLTGTDDREPDPPVGAIAATEIKSSSPTSPANAKKYYSPEVEIVEIDSDDEQGREREASVQRGRTDETTQPPSDELANSQDLLQGEITEAPKTPPHQRRSKSRGVPTAGLAFLAPEGQSRGSDLLTSTLRSPPVLREEHTIEIPGTTDNIQNSPSPRRSPIVQKFAGISQRTSGPDHGSVNQIPDSHAKPVTRGVSLANSMENSTAGESESELLNELNSTDKSSDSRSPSPPLKRKRIRAPPLGPRKARKTKQDVEEGDESMGDCIVVLPPPGKLPPPSKSASGKTTGRKSKNATKSLEPSDYSNEKLSRMSPTSYNKRMTLTRLTGVRKRLASQSTELDDSAETPTGRKKKARNSNSTTPPSSAKGRKSARLNHASVPSPRPAHDAVRHSHAYASSEDVSRVEDSQVVTSIQEVLPREMKHMGTIDGGHVAERGNIGSYRKQIGHDEGVSASESGGNFETAREVPSDADEITVSFTDKPNPVPTETASGIPNIHAHTSNSERGSSSTPVMGRGIIDGLKKILRDIQRAVLGREEAIEVRGLLGDISNQVNKASTS
ncbi:hypothetical protein GP486_004374 [Trichoglossum hirsutum]|uniref:Telomere-associated protein Rif1 N-terminal domain-containing protein n=1 Tax=Trichoglossum hirsutum TaxID=265104 RepID=A0A9P8LBA6_9PEZI|nr:hypothetical protein GP486_004374 [Trichoglossum hirsutum]